MFVSARENREYGKAPGPRQYQILRERTWRRRHISDNPIARTGRFCFTGRMGEQIDIQKEVFSDRTSKLDKYADLVIGRRGWGALIKYELIQLICRNTPGALGLLLRSKLYPLLLGQCGRNVNFGVGVTLRHPHKIELGEDVVIDDYCLLDAKGKDNRGIRIGNGVFIGRHTILSCKNGDIVLGDRVNIGFNAEIFSGSVVTLEDDVLVAAYVYFIGGGHAFDRKDVRVLDQERTSEGIHIERQCWFGAGAKIQDGVRVCANTIVGTGAVVTENLPANVVAVGIPARVIRER